MDEDFYDKFDEFEEDSEEDREIAEQRELEIDQPSTSKPLTKKKKKKTKKSTSQQIFDKISKETAELDQLLVESQNIRDEALRRQHIAYSNFEEELLAIGDLSSIEAYFSVKDRPVSQTVDHNLTRLLMNSNDQQKAYPSTLQKKFIDESCDSYDDDFDEEMEDCQRDHMKSQATGADKAFPTIVATKKPVEPLSFEAKGGIRVKIIDLLESSRSMETQLEEDLIISRSEDPKKCRLIAEELYLVQKENLHRLKELIADYHPSSIGKTWRSDPEQIEFSRKVREALLLDDPLAGITAKNALTSGMTSISNRSHQRR